MRLTALPSTESTPVTESSNNLGAKGDWAGAKAMASDGDWLYAIDGSTLYRVNPGNGKFKQLGAKGAWGTSSVMTIYHDELFIIPM